MNSSSDKCDSGTRDHESLAAAESVKPPRETEMFGAFSGRLPGDYLTNREPTLCISSSVCVHACYSLRVFMEQPRLCTRASATRGKCS